MADASSLIASRVEEHRRIETGLDRLAASLKVGQIDAGIIHEVSDAIARHYLREEEFVTKLHGRAPDLAAKLTAQHAEALEIAARLEECLSPADSRDLTYLVRRLLAIAQHNIIEEERDIFPLALRLLSGKTGR